MKKTFLLALLLLNLKAMAGDIVADVSSSAYQGNGNYFEVGLVAGFIDNPLVRAADRADGAIIDVDAGGAYQYKSFFIEASQGSQDGVNVGINIWNNRHWSVDILAASLFQYLPPRDVPKHSKNEQERREKKLLSRDTIYSGSGIRITNYYNDYVFQYRLVTDTFSARGMISTLRFGRGWQVRNWNIHTILSAQYTSKKTNDYWFGVDRDETTVNFPIYTPEASLHYSALLGLTYPLSENWVFRSFAGYVTVPKTVRDSPIVEGDHLKLLVSTINYVF